MECRVQHVQKDYVGQGWSELQLHQVSLDMFIIYKSFCAYCIVTGLFEPT